jgi:hypothetical protein
MVIWILLACRIGFGVTGLGTCRCDTGGSRLLPGAMLEACGLLSYPNYGSVHAATNHENSTTMSLYGYDLAKYVVESNLGIPTSCVGKLRWQNRFDVR